MRYPSSLRILVRCKAGHESVTRRNRLGLCLLETTYLDKLVTYTTSSSTLIQQQPVLSKRKERVEKTSFSLSTGTFRPLSFRTSASRRRAAGRTTAIKNAKDWVRSILNRESVDGPRGNVKEDQSEACRNLLRTGKALNREKHC